MLTPAETKKPDKTNIQTLYQPTHTNPYTLYKTKDTYIMFSSLISRSTSIETLHTGMTIHTKLHLFELKLIRSLYASKAVYAILYMKSASLICEMLQN